MVGGGLHGVGLLGVALLGVGLLGVGLLGVAGGAGVLGGVTGVAGAGSGVSNAGSGISGCTGVCPSGSAGGGSPYPGVRSINAKNLLELALGGLDNKTNVSGMLSSFRLYSSVALPTPIYQEHDPTLESGISHNSMHDVDDRP